MRLLGVVFLLGSVEGMLRRVMLGKGNVGETRMFDRKGKGKGNKEKGRSESREKRRKSEDWKVVKKEL